MGRPKGFGKTSKRYYIAVGAAIIPEDLMLDLRERIEPGEVVYYEVWTETRPKYMKPIRNTPSRASDDRS